LSLKRFVNFVFCRRRLLRFFLLSLSFQNSGDSNENDLGESRNKFTPAASTAIKRA
jgi:hypothetical protein